MNPTLDALDQRFSIASGPCKSLVTGKVQLATEHTKAGWTDLQRKNAKPPSGKVQRKAK